MAGANFENSQQNADSTKTRNIFLNIALGQFTHLAVYHAGVIVRSALFGLPAKASTAHLPWATYTDPEMALVGLTEAQARAGGGRLDGGRALD